MLSFLCSKRVKKGERRKIGGRNVYNSFFLKLSALRVQLYRKIAYVLPLHSVPASEPVVETKVWIGPETM